MIADNNATNEEYHAYTECVSARKPALSIKFGRILQLKDAKRYAIDKKQHIGNTHIVFHAIGNLELIDSTEDIAVCIVKVNKTNIEVHTIAMTGITVAVANELKGVAQTFKVALPGNVTQIVDNLGDIAIGQVWILILQINAQIINLRIFDKQWLPELTVDISAISILPALCLQQINQGFFIFTLVKFSFHDVNF